MKTDFVAMAAEYQGHGMSMDARHAQMIGDFIRALPPCDVAEIGCYHGISTAEILAVAKKGVTLVDYPRFQHNVTEMARIKGPSVKMLPVAGEEWLQASGAAAPGAVIILDGDHRWEVVRREITLCLAKGYERIILHDVANPAGDCDGPAKALTELQKKGFFVAIDQQHRPGERTERGLAFCCKKADDYKVAMEAVCGRC